MPAIERVSAVGSGTVGQPVALHKDCPKLGAAHAVARLTERQAVWKALLDFLQRFSSISHPSISWAKAVRFEHAYCKTRHMLVSTGKTVQTLEAPKMH